MKTTLFTFILFALFTSWSSAEPAIRSGDRIAIVGNTFADQLRIHGYLETLLRQRTDLSVRNLGWGGDMLTSRDRPTGFPTEEVTLTDHKTDVIIACFGMGESFGGEAGLKGFSSDLKAFIVSHSGKKYNGTSSVRLVLVSPIAQEDLGKLTPGVKKRNADLKAYTEVMREVAVAAKLPFIDLYEPTRYIMEGGSGPNLTGNGITLNPFGYWAISHEFYKQLSGESLQPWSLSIDAQAQNGSAKGVTLSKIVANKNSFSFSVAENTPPSLPAPGYSESSPQPTAQRDTLVVKNLSPGSYTLAVDGMKVVTAEHDQWARGIAIDTSPAHREAKDLRSAINDKNLQFTYSWKALNQVHIVGERKSSPSGRSLPAEVIEFNKLSRYLEAKLPPKHDTLRKRQWQLAPTKTDFK